MNMPKTSLRGKNWKLRHQRTPDESLWQGLLEARGIADPGSFFASASLADLHDPFLFPDMPRAVQRIRAAIHARERIVIYGDYDVDGTSGAAILIHTLRFLGAEVSYRIPHRIHDGYGLHNKIIDELAELDVSLLITVDCGISCATEVAHAQDHKLDIIITDHHHVPEQLPEAHAILHPELAPDYPFKHLAGSGVAFKLASALLIDTNNEDLIPRFTDLASLGTVADCVPLTGENRALLKIGLKQMENTQWPGLEALLRNANASAPFSSETIGFQVGPRINASGRISSPLHALQALINEGESARQKSLQLEELNQKRRLLTQEAQEEVEAHLDHNQPLLIAAGPWTSGIVGLIAGRLQEKHGKPAFILQDRGDTLVGSARSLPGFHAVHALNQVADLLMGYGGHEQAAGFSLSKANFSAFRERLQAYAAEHFQKHPLKSELLVDLSLHGPEVSLDTIEKIQTFAPFGVGNPQPLFLLDQARLHSARPVGSTGAHLKLQIAHDGQIHEGIAFNFAEYEAALQDASQFLVQLEANEWQGTRSPQLKLVDAL